MDIKKKCTIFAPVKRKAQPNQITKTMVNNISTVNSNAVIINNVINQSLPALSGAKVSYDAERNLFVAEGWSSPANNYYYEALRVSPRLTMLYEIGVGYARTFLNGLRLYCHDGQKHKLIGQRWFSCCFLNEETARLTCADMLSDFLLTQQQMLNQNVTKRQLEPVVKALVADLYNGNRNRLTA